ncbi:MAG: FprA family A-type flavoprotein [Clostridia bacterium]|nr:FprA family A-type flavoprotein [Clostridia bacterium]
MQVANGVYCISVNDKKIDLFEGQFPVPNGIAYNSYVIVDEKIAVFDTVDKSFGEEWLGRIKEILQDKTPDYLIIQHMEPDHSANIVAFTKTYPNAKILSSSKSFMMMKNYFGTDFADRQAVVGEGSTLSLGRHNLTFFAAPMVHWPEVLVCYDNTDKILFSADAFGKFGATDVEEEWACEARRYYFGIVGKYGVQVQNLLKKLAGFEITKICPLHGPVLQENLEYYLHLYNIWSSYGVETEGVMIAYTSVYGHTKEAVALLAERLRAKGCQKVVVTDLARAERTEAVEDAFRYGKIVLATTTYNGEIFPFMRDFIHELTERNFQNRTVGFIENGSWAPMATRVMQGLLEKCKNLHYAQSSPRILSAMTEENKAEIERLAEELLK